MGARLCAAAVVVDKLLELYGGPLRESRTAAVACAARSA